MICKHCGSEIQDNSKFCPSCGASLAEVNEKPAPEPEKKGSIMKTVGKVIGGLVLVSIIGSCMSGNKDNKDVKPTNAPKKVVTQLNADQVNFLKTVGITDPVVTIDGKNTKTFTSKGNIYVLTLNDQNGIKEVSKQIGSKQWYVWTDNHGKWDVPENDGKYIIVDIDDMNAQLKRNAARASKNYKGVDVKFVGWINNIDSNGDYISVRGQDRYAILTSFHCRLRDKKHKDVVINKNEGNKVTIKGQITDVGEIMGYRVKVDDIQ